MPTSRPSLRGGHCPLCKAIRRSSSISQQWPYHAAKPRVRLRCARVWRSRG
jgi:hypothetical protein